MRSVTSSAFGSLDRVVEVGRDDEPLARGAVVGAQPLAQLGVVHVVLEVREARLLDHLDLGRLGVDDRVGEARRTFRRALRAAPRRRSGSSRNVGRPPRRSTRGFSCGMIHCAVRWNSDSFATRSTIADDDLHRGRTGADDADPCAVELHAVVPAGAVEHRAGEGVEPLDVGILRVVEHARSPRSRRRPRRDGPRAVSSCHRPFANGAARDLVAEADAVDHVVLAARRARSRPGSRRRARSGGSTRG